MMRRAGLAAILMMLLSTASVSAVPTQVEIFNYGYDPTPLKIALDAQVQWHNGSDRNHTAYADFFLQWGVNTTPGSTSFAVTFHEAGNWAYHCTIHSQMHGSIKVKMKSTPTSGTLSTTFVIRVATFNADTGFLHDIRRRKHGGVFTLWKSIAGQTANFSPSSKGTWEFQGRVRHVSDGVATGWSPTLTVTVN